MTTALLRRVATGVAVAATLAVPALTAAPAHADVRTETTLSIKTVRSAVAPGGSTDVTGVLLVKGLGGQPGRTVALEAKPLGTEEFVPVAEAVTGDHGGVRVTVTPETTTRYRWHYAGDDTTRPSVSGVARIGVRTPDHPATRLNTTLTIRAGERVIAPDGQAMVRGRLAVRRVPVQHRWVVLLSRTPDADGWAFGEVQRTNVLGRVAFAVAPDDRTAYRLVFLGTPLLQPVRSAIVHLAVRPTVTIAADPTVVDPGGTTTVSGTVATISGPVAGATVELLARTVGSRDELAVVGTGTTAEDGTVAITATPLRHSSTGSACCAARACRGRSARGCGSTSGSRRRCRSAAGPPRRRTSSAACSAAIARPCPTGPSRCWRWHRARPSGRRSAPRSRGCAARCGSTSRSRRARRTNCRSPAVRGSRPRPAARSASRNRH